MARRAPVAPLPPPPLGEPPAPPIPHLRLASLSSRAAKLKKPAKQLPVHTRPLVGALQRSPAARKAAAKEQAQASAKAQQKTQPGVVASAAAGAGEAAAKGVTERARETRKLKQDAAQKQQPKAAPPTRVLPQTGPLTHHVAPGAPTGSTGGLGASAGANTQAASPHYGVGHLGVRQVQVLNSNKGQGVRRAPPTQELKETKQIKKSQEKADREAKKAQEKAARQAGKATPAAAGHALDPEAVKPVDLDDLPPSSQDQATPSQGERTGRLHGLMEKARSRREAFVKRFVRKAPSQQGARTMADLDTPDELQARFQGVGIPASQLEIAETPEARERNEAIIRAEAARRGAEADAAHEADMAEKAKMAKMTRRQRERYLLRKRKGKQ